MPYFERKPWQEATTTLERAARPSGDEYDFAEAAKGILGAEKACKASGQGAYRCRRTVAPGGTAEIVLGIACDGAGGALDLVFSCDGLAGPGGTRIDAGSVTLDPQRISVAPGSEERLTVRVRVPRDALAGHYLGRVKGAGPEPVVFDISIDVAPAA